MFNNFFCSISSLYYHSVFCVVINVLLHQNDSENDLTDLVQLLIVAQATNDLKVTTFQTEKRYVV